MLVCPDSVGIKAVLDGYILSKFICEWYKARAVTMKNSLLEKKCIPCELGFLPLQPEQIEKFLLQLESPWELIDGIKIKYKFVFKTFKQAVRFVNKVADLAEKENQHPNIFIAYNKVTITCTTHIIKGLTENDFILASKIAALV